ncbi:amino acid adenylation domain-containing protein [Bradyrhizobium sp. USDA 4369]
MQERPLHEDDFGVVQSLLTADGFRWGDSTIIPRCSEGPVEASFAQSRLWFLSQLRPNDWSYNLAAAFRIEGQVDCHRLERSFTRVIERHEILNTLIKTQDGKPFQVPSGISGASVRVTQLDVACNETPDPLSDVMRAEVVRPFDLANDLPFRLNLFRTSDGTAVFLVVVHHVAADGWSIALLARDFATAFLQNGERPLPALRISYRDFAAWERQRWTDGFMEQPLAYWLTRLRGAPLCLDFPFDSSRRMSSPRARRTVFSLPRIDVDGPARRLRSSSYIVLLTIYAFLLARYSGADDLLIGATAAGRTRPELEEIVGLFANTLVHRFQFDWDVSFATQIQRFTQEVFADLDHQDVPFDKVVQRSLSERKGNSSPLFQVAFVLQNGPQLSESLPGAAITQVSVPVAATRFDLSLAAELVDDQYRMTLYYRDGLLSDEFAADFCRRYAIALANVANDERTPLRRVSILSDDEQMSFVSNPARRSAAPLDTERTVFDVISERSNKSPDEIALMFGHHRWSYRDLMLRVAEVSEALRTKGVRSGSVVGLLMRRSAETVATILGILSAGAVYVPLDPDYPASRLSFMEDDSDMVVVVTDTNTMNGTSWVPGSMLIIDEVSRGACGVYEAGLPGDAIYIMYTSGSTGQPKAAINLNRGIVNFVEGIQQSYPIGPGDRVLHKASLQFDVSAWEIFWPLMHGASIVIAPSGAQSDPTELERLIDTGGVTVAHFVPSMLAAFLAGISRNSCPTLATVFVGGEALPPDLISRFGAKLRAQLINSYGPTETSIGVTLWECEADYQGAVSPIGYPMPNVRLYVLDKHLNPVPDGVPGQLFIAGNCLGAGYLNRPDLNRERFLCEPGYSGKQMYASGDLVRRRPDGSLLFLGRLDHQVKIRGQRVELGEIETILRQVPGVRDAVVLAQKRASEGGRLVAYVCRSAGAILDELIVRSALARELPSAMVPSRVILLDDLPTTVNGKLDSARLPEPDLEDGSQPVPKFMSAIEAMAADIFYEVLGRRPENANAEFFAMGGHSLLAVQVLSIAYQRTGKRIRLAQFVEDSTVGALATLLGEPTVRDNGSVHFLRRGTSGFTLVLIHPALGLISGYREIASAMPPSWNVLGIENVDTLSEEESIEEKAAVYLSWIEDMLPGHRVVLGGWSSGGLIACEMARLMSNSGAAPDLLALIDSHLHDDPGARFATDYKPWVGFIRALGLDIDVLEALPSEEFIRGSEEKRIALITEQLRRIPTGGGDMTTLIRSYRSNALAASRYRPDALHVPSTLFIASEYSDPDLMRRRWSAILPLCEYLNLDATHESIVRANNATSIAAAIDSRVSARPRLP